MLSKMTRRQQILRLYINKSTRRDQFPVIIPPHQIHIDILIITSNYTQWNSDLFAKYSNKLIHRLKSSNTEVLCE